MRPRSVLLGSVPVFGQCRFAQQGGFGKMRRFVFENRDDGVARGGQMDFFEQPHRAAFVNHRFDCSIHN